MPTTTSRHCFGPPIKINFGAAVADSTTICMSPAVGFAIYVPTGTASTTVTWYASPRIDGPWYPVVLSSGTAATTSVVAEKTYVSPADFFPLHFVRGVDGTAFSAYTSLKS